MYILTAIRWEKKNGRITKTSRKHEIDFRCNTLKECMDQLNNWRQTNELDKFTPFEIINVVNTEEL